MKKDTGGVAVYFLRCPITREIRYIGKAKCVRHRYNGHVAEAKLGISPKDRWLKNLLRKGIRPIVDVVFSQLSNRQSLELEKRLIFFHQSHGSRLLNRQIAFVQDSENGRRKFCIKTPVDPAKLKGSFSDLCSLMIEVTP
jgi:hypothetical protein